MNDEVERLKAELKEANEAILELQREACARDGVPMPSERPLVDELKIKIQVMEQTLLEAATRFDVYAANNRRRDLFESARINGKYARSCRAAAGFTP